MLLLRAVRGLRACSPRKILKNRHHEIDFKVVFDKKAL